MTDSDPRLKDKESRLLQLPVQQRTRPHSLGYPLLFHWLALLVFAGILLLAALLHIVPLLLLTLLLLALAASAWFWSRRALDSLDCRVSLNQDRAFPGETVELLLEVSNRKRLPLFWLEIEVAAPYRLVRGTGSPSIYARERLRWTTSLRGGQTLTWRHALECRARGEYHIGPARLRSGDVFGLFPRETVLPRSAPLLVYPRLVPVDRLSLPMRELTGERGIPRSIYEDASRLMGVRDYQPEDALKNIHWKASARQSRLQTKLFESSTSQGFLFILDVGSFCASGNEEDFELAVTAAASLAHEASREGCAIGLAANSVPQTRIPVASGHRQLLAILESLARVAFRSETPLYDMIEKQRLSLPLGATPLVVSSVSPLVVSVVRRLEQGGHSPVVVSVGESRTQPPPGVLVLPVRSPGDLSRRYRGDRADG